MSDNDKTLMGQAKNIVTMVHTQLKRSKVAVTQYMRENCDRIGPNVMNPARATARITGLHERTIYRYHNQQSTRGNLDPVLHQRGRKQRNFPDWVIGLLRTTIMSM